MNLAADILLHPTFPESELNKMKQRLRVQLQQQRSSPMFLVQERFNRAVYGNHPAADHIDHRGIDREDHARAAGKMVQGALRPAERDPRYRGRCSSGGSGSAVQRLAALGSQRQQGGRAPPTKAASGRRIYVVDRPGSVQTDIFLGNIAVTRIDPDYVPLVVMDRIVGGGASARLFLNLREEHGYTYGAYSMLVARKYAGPWIAEASMRTDATGGAMTEFMNEVNRIRDKAVPESELGGIETRHRGRLRAVPRGSQPVAGLRDYSEDLWPSGGLLGHLSGQNHERYRRASAARRQTSTLFPTPCRSWP